MNTAIEAHELGHNPFSGFSSKEEERVYHNSLFKVIYFIQLRLVKLLNGSDEQEIDASQYEVILKNLIFKIQWMEQTKAAQPNFSNALKDVTRWLGLNMASQNEALERRLVHNYAQGSHLEQATTDIGPEKQISSRAATDLRN